MDLLDRYVSAIASQLPDEQKADVTAELRDLLMSQVEEKEAELGRPLQRSGMEALLKAFGHPLVVAGRYRKFNQLIGPDVFPFYWFGLRLALMIVAVVHIILAAIFMVTSSDPGHALGEAIGRLVTNLIATVGWVTIAAVVIEHTGVVKQLQTWNPRHLPPAVVKPRKSRFEVAVEIALSLLFIAWWMGWTAWSPQAAFDPDRLYFVGGPMREALHWPVLALAIAGIGVSAVELVRPGWNRLNAGLGLAWNLAALTLLIIYVRGGDLLIARGELPAEQMARAEHGVNLGLKIGLAVLAVILAWEALKDAWWWLRGRAPQAGWALAGRR
jgi:hypothetical protein